MKVSFVQMSLLIAASFFGRGRACGGFFCAPQQPVVQSGEAIVFGVSGTEVTMHVLINYEGPAEDFSWLLPVMFEPTLETSSDPLFISMFQQTLPQFRFNILENNSTTCTADPSTPGPCPVFAPAPPPSAAADEGGGVKVIAGSVGPFDYKIIKAVDRNVEAVTDWLAENGYDEYTGSRAIIAHYVKSDHCFITMRLRKDSDSGDIVPVQIKYEMPSGMDTIACIPLILTGVAATSTMPIQVYVLGEHRADPVNYFRVHLDDTKVDWLGCQFNPSCYDRDYRDRSTAAFRLVNDHAFVVEYAGPSSIMSNQIRFDLDEASLASSQSVNEFLATLANANVPSFTLLDNIINDYIPLKFADSDPFGCSSWTSIYNPSNPFVMESCADALMDRVYDFPALANEIQTEVLLPAASAQTFTDSFKYLTRLWVNMRQDQMIKDPFFRFRQDSALPDVSNVHSAIGIPVCDSLGLISQLEITVDDGRKTNIGAYRDECFGWTKTDFNPLFGEKDSSALFMTVPAFGEEEDRILLRQDDGTFNDQEISEYFLLMDSRVMNQTIDPYPPPTSTVTPPPSPANEENDASCSRYSVARMVLMSLMWSLLF